MNSFKAARTHTHASNRAKPYQLEERKTVFKSVLDNPFRIRWPSVPINAQNAILAHMITTLQGVSDYHHARNKANRKRKRGSEAYRSKKSKINEGDSNEKTADEAMNLDISTSGAVNLSTSSVVPLSVAPDLPQCEPPTIFPHLVFGINEVTKRLESQIRKSRSIISKDLTSATNTQLDLRFIFACRADVDPPLLLDHIPHLIAAFNSTQKTNFIKLIPLPKGAETLLAQAVGLRSVSVLGISIDLPHIPSLDSVATLTATWLTPSQPTSQLVPTHIKQVRTSAPKDMKASKERRTKGRLSAKKRQKTMS